MVLRINQALQQAGFNVWIDVEQMKGSTVDAMAAAVEGSCCIVICMSRGQKESANCRLEANYAQVCKIPMVFVMLEDGYTPDGWAGILKASVRNQPLLPRICSRTLVGGCFVPPF